MKNRMIGFVVTLVSVSMFWFSQVAFAQTCINQVPDTNQATSAVTSSGDYSNGYNWKAFDQTHGTMWFSSLWTTPAWLGYQFSSPKVIDRYTIDYANGSITSRAPKDFTLQGSNGSTWTTVDSQIGEVNWSGSSVRTYDVSNPGSYKEYRLHITDDNDSRGGNVLVSIGGLTLETCALAPISISLNCAVNFPPRRYTCFASITGGSPDYVYKWEIPGGFTIPESTTGYIEHVFPCPPENNVYVGLIVSDSADGGGSKLLSLDIGDCGI